MSKVASYLQNHLSGEVSVAPFVLDAMSRDSSVLQIKPELVVYPRTTNDIRKIARFSWQLAERGHTLPITARGSGSDQTGAAIGRGIILSFPAHMNSLFEFEPRRKLVRVQPGANARTLSDALWLNGASIPALPVSSAYSTVGGAVANNSIGITSGKYGNMLDWIEQLEVVLANGEVIQTGRISRRELNRKKGIETLEGEIYRSLDNLIEDNKELVTRLSGRNDFTNAGYVSIASVKGKDGSFDLTPLMTGSQGTLGIISEMILRADYIGNDMDVIVGAFKDKDAARDCIEALKTLNPAFLDYIDGTLLHIAAKAGKQYSFMKDAGSEIDAVVVIGFDDSRDRSRSKRIKKTAKLLKTFKAWSTTSDQVAADELLSIIGCTSYSHAHGGVGSSAPPILNGAFIPSEQFGFFSAGMAALAEKYRMPLPLFGHELNSIYYAWPVFNLKKPGDKQKILKLLDDIALLVDKVGGELVGVSGEGRLKSRFTSRSFDDETNELFSSIKTIFDPYGILNTGVKQSIEIKELAAMFRDEYHSPAPPEFIPAV